MKNRNTNEIISDKGDVLLSCTGTLNDWSWPDIPGIHDYKGELLHSASWDESFDWKVRAFYQSMES